MVYLICVHFFSWPTRFGRSSPIGLGLVGLWFGTPRVGSLSGSLVVGPPSCFVKAVHIEAF